MLSIKVRQGIRYFERDCKMVRDSDKMYGLVVVADDYFIGVVPVDCLYNEFGVRVYYCYDEPEAKLDDRWRHNILLKDSPKPFTHLNSGILISEQVVHMVFVKADRRLVERISVKDFTVRGVELVDDGFEISDDEWCEIFNHMNITQLQKEFTYKSMLLNSCDFLDNFSEFSERDDYEL